MKYLKYLLPIVALAMTAGAANIDLRALRTGDFDTNAGYVATRTWTNNNGQMTLKTNVPIYVDYLTGGPVGTGAEFDIDPISGTAATNPNTYALVGFNGNPPLGAAGVENNGSGQIGVAGGALLYGDNTNGAVAGVLGITERAHTTGIGVVGTSFGQAGTTNVGVVGSAQGGDNLVGGYFETATAKSADSRGYGGAAIIADVRDTTNAIFIGRTNGATTYRVRSDGSVFSGKSVSMDSSYLNYGTYFPLYSVSMLSSNEPSDFSLSLISANDLSYNYFSQFLITGHADADNPNMFFEMYAYSTNSNTQKHSKFSLKIGEPVFAADTNYTRFFEIGEFGDLDLIKGVAYSWPTSHGPANSVLTDTVGDGTLSWAAGTVIVPGTNVAVATNGSAYTISVANTNLPIVAAGTNITVVTNGLGYTVSVTGLTNVINALATNAINQNARIGPGTVNQIAKFSNPTNVQDSVVNEIATNMWVWASRGSGVAFTNFFTNRIYGEFTNPTNWLALDIVAAQGHGNAYYEIHGAQGASAAGDDIWPLKLHDAMVINSGIRSPGGLTAGYVTPATDNSYSLGTGSKRWLGVDTGPQGFVVFGQVASMATVNLGAGAGWGVSDTDVNFIKGGNALMKFSGGSAGDQGLNLGVLPLMGGGAINVNNSFLMFQPNGICQLGTNNINGAGTPQTNRLQGILATGTDIAGGRLVIAGGQSTGTGANGSVDLATAEKATSTGSTANTHKTRERIAPDPVTLTESTATLVLNVTLASGKFCGMRIMATTDADDGTDFQALSETVSIAAVNKAGTITTVVSASVPSAMAASAGTLANTWTAVQNGSSVDVKLSSVSSLTQTTLKVRYRVELDGDGTLVVTP